MLTFDPKQWRVWLAFKDAIDNARPLACSRALPRCEAENPPTSLHRGLSENLWKWLRSAPDGAWTLTEHQYLTQKSDVFRLVGIHNPGNVLRHSFCSYHVAKHKDAARIAVILCHASPRMLYQHYKGRATGTDAAVYFSIAPKGPHR